jgi:hypothetical protein
VFDWLLQQGAVQLTCDTMRTAAQWGRLQLCQWLRAAECEWDHTVCSAAAHGGHVSTLRWLMTNGCPWTVETLYTSAIDCTAASNSAVAVLQLLLEQGVLADAAVLTSALNYAGAKNKLAAAQLLKQQGAEWPAVLYCSGVSWSGESLAWARAEGCTAPTEAQQPQQLDPEL